MDLSQFMMGGGQMPQPGTDSEKPDTAEQIHISSLALLKMMKHGKFAYV